ncbi:NAD-dependent epimerase/dehydratase family protein [Streptomyces sp. NPDC026672]|uniref:NAD-dependent epimerase/dehydratase family protein n=1 Tax=unclassified Streptomyces TaxID=2593676 RepID=UPI0033C18323
MKILLFGATGTVGEGALRACLRAPDVEEVLAVTRRTTGVTHERLRELHHDDFTDYSAIAERLAGYDACFWCLGRSSRELDEAEYTRVTYEFPVAAAGALAPLAPDMAFFYVSALDADPRSKNAARRTKGLAEEAVLRLFPETGCAVRPAFVQPTDPASAARYSLGYRISVRLHPVLDRALPRYVTTAEAIGRAMLDATRDKVPQRVLQGFDLR